jgi:hypothetical protein
MRVVRKFAFLCLVLFTLALLNVVALPEPAQAWSVCHEGTTRWTDLHCMLGFAGDCTECWVTPVV